MFNFLLYIFLSLETIFCFKSNIETAIFTNIQNIDNNYIFNILDKTNNIYTKSGLDIQFYVKNINFIVLNKTDISIIINDIKNINNYDFTLLLLYLENDVSTKGISYVNSICTYNSISIVNMYDIDDILIPYILAHELGHVYGAEHDNSNINIMNSIINYDHDYTFSSRSINSMNFERNCLLNYPENYIYKSNSTLISNSNRNKISMLNLLIILKLIFLINGYKFT